MRISSRRDLDRLDKWKGSPLRILNQSNVEDVLGGKDGDAIGVYFLGHSANGSHDSFVLRYVGKAVDQPLHDRLLQHVKGSHNPHVRKALADAANGRGRPVYFRFAIFTSVALAEEVEGLSIAAFLWEGPDAKERWGQSWNRRNEWRQHWPEEGEE
jgi:hypothetical protein